MKELEIRSKNINGVDYKYSIYPLVSKDNEVLTTPTPKFDFVNPPADPTFLAISLLETMASNWGVGLAAPQVGLPYRVFTMGSGNNGYVCFNPEIISTEGMTGFDEGCLTFKGLFLNIKRPLKIKTRYQDMTGKHHEIEFDGLTARTYQHELDHLNGVLYTKLVNPYFLDKAKKKVPSNIKKLDAQRNHQIKQIAIQQAIQRIADQKKAEELSKAISISIPDVTIST
jgi:peptide deformylase